MGYKDSGVRKEYAEKWHMANKERRNKRAAEWYQKNKDRVKERATERRVELRAYQKEYRRLNTGKIRAWVNKRYSSKLDRTPPWLTKEHFDDIEDTYVLAKKLEELCGVKYHVDHIVPLQGKNVCGLHVPWNLQVLEASLNMKKGNSHDW